VFRLGETHIRALIEVSKPGTSVVCFVSTKRTSGL